MTNFKAIDWKKIGTDLGHGLGRSVAAVKKGALVAGKKAGELAGEGQRQYRVLVLKSKARDSFIELGSLVFSLSGRHSANPLLDEKVKGVIARIRKFESQITTLEKEHRTAPIAEKRRRTTMKRAA